MNDSWHDLYQLARRANGDGLPRKAHDRSEAIDFDARPRTGDRPHDPRPGYRSVTHEQARRLPFEVSWTEQGTEDAAAGMWTAAMNSEA